MKSISTSIRIGIVSPKSLYLLIHEAIKGFPNFIPVFREVDASSPTESIVKELLGEVEVLMIPEYHLYTRMKQKVNFMIPVHHLPLAGTGLYRALAVATSKNPTRPISIDSFSGQDIDTVLAEIEEEPNYALFPQEEELSIPELVYFHKQNYLQHQMFVLTAIHEVAKQLEELQIPYLWATPTRQDIIVSLERALLSTETRRNKESQIVFGLVNIDNFKGITMRYGSEHDLQMLKLKLHQKLLEYTKLVDGHLIHLGGVEYSFITTRGIFERETRGYKYIPLLSEVRTQLGVTISLGIGFGRTPAESGNHARLALRQVIDSGGNAAYIVREDQSVIGPVDVSSQQHYEMYDLAITDPELLKRAEKAGMSASYMTKLMARVSRHDKVEYTAQELANTLNITLRSANRILLKWTDADLVEIVGEEQVTTKGRPRRLYRLTFVNDRQR